MFGSVLLLVTAEEELFDFVRPMYSPTLNAKFGFIFWVQIRYIHFLVGFVAFLVFLFNSGIALTCKTLSKCKLKCSIWVWRERERLLISLQQHSVLASHLSFTIEFWFWALQWMEIYKSDRTVNTCWVIMSNIQVRWVSRVELGLIFLLPAILIWEYH